MLVHKVVDLTSGHARRYGPIFFSGKRGGRFGLRFNLSPRARCALRLGEGPRAFGFSIIGISLFLIILVFLLLLQTKGRPAFFSEQK
ncbi:MAG: hypothetical protein DME75_01140 [Verrucomicrobia bacterium]|nr:MAG: hypothetical protein DME75_01140 [Verrucomicrobiota bacterium]